jgi:uncharacterized ferredoxin-like protein
MALKYEEGLKIKALKKIAIEMMIAARTAPKGKGIDTLKIAFAEKEDIEMIAKRMFEIDQEMDFPAFSRDAKNILNADAMIILGTIIKPLGLKKCGMCGYKNCAEKEKYPDHPCTLNTTDLGIALGSAVSVAMDKRVDNRILYTAGQAILDLKLLGEKVKVAYAIPLSSSSKNIFFDRK